MNRKSKMLSPTSLQKYLEKNINDITRNSCNSDFIYDEFIEDNNNKKENEDLKEQNNIKNEDNSKNEERDERKDNNLDKRISEPIFNNSITINDKQKTLDKKSKTQVFKKKDKNKNNIDKTKIFQKITNKYIGPSNYSLKTFDENNIKKVLTELENEIVKRNHYLNLFKKSNIKIKKLYSQLVNHSIDLTNNIDKIDLLDTNICNNLDIFKVIFNNINNNYNSSVNKNENKLNKKDINTFLMNLNDKNKNIIKGSIQSFNSKKKTKTYYKRKTKSQINKYNKKNKIKNEQIFINVNRPLLIFNTSKTFDTKENKVKN